MIGTARRKEATVADEPWSMPRRGPGCAASSAFDEAARSAVVPRGPVGEATGPVVVPRGPVGDT